MTKFRATLTSFACVAALATSAAHADVYKMVRLTDMLVSQATSGAHDDLPAPPPKLPAHTPEFANPRSASDPAPSQRVPTIRKEWSAATPQQFPAAPQTTADGKFAIRKMPGRVK
jgi:hypothetical protein